MTRMERLWAPWRKAYVRPYIKKKEPHGCLFCRVRSAPARKDAANLVVLRSTHSFIILNRYPYNNGHLMVVPNRHLASIEGLKDPERLDLLRLLDRSLGGLHKMLKAGGFNVGLNLGRVSGAGVVDHVHLHVVPRWEGDTSFMPIFSGTKVISDSLKETYRELARALR